MKTYIKNSISIALLIGAIAFSNNPALADNVNLNSVDAVQQAAEKVTEDTGVKEQFGKSKNGDRLLDAAQNKASEKLNKIAQEAKSDSELPDSKKLFLDNLKN